MILSCRQRVAALTLLVVGASLLAACGGETVIGEKESVSESGSEVLALSGPLTLDLTSGVGEVTVQAGDDPTQLVIEYVKTAYGRTEDEARAGLAAMTLAISQEADTVTINSVQQACDGQSRSNTVDLTISVPPAIGLRLVNNVGEVLVRGVQLSEGATLSADVGRIRLLDVAALNGLEVSSNVGEVVFEGTLGAGGTYELTSNVGAVTLRLDGELSARVDAATNVGKVTIEGVALRGAIRSSEGASASVRGIAGDGGATLTVRTNVGEVRISAR